MTITANSTQATAAATAAPLTKNAKRRLKKKLQQQAQPPSSPPLQDPQPSQPPSLSIDATLFQIDRDSDDFKAFSHVFSRFQSMDGGQDSVHSSEPQKGQVIYSDDEMLSDQDASDAEGRPSLSKRKQRKLQRLTVSELKQLVKKPEVVEWTDVTANDPRLLVHLKCLRNTIPVPPHWSQKRDYLQNKRGIEKPQYKLPSYIADTGIATMKDALKEKEAEQSLKQKTRDRVQPKMGKMDIDYQKLHDAFFKFQTKPTLTAYGDTYYEGKENETKFKDKKPGELSEELIEALSIPPLAPPPWLIAMQRYGLPPSYPHLKIPGLNSAIPEGAQWGFHPGGWGRPPVDEYGNPLFGDVLGSAAAAVDHVTDPVQKEPWGEVEAEEEDDDHDLDDQDDIDESTDSEEESQNGAPNAGGDGLETPSGLDTPSGMASVTSTIPGGLETPEYLELRKDSRVASDSFMPPEVTNNQPRQLYQVLDEQETSVRGLMGSEKVYDLSSSYGPALGTEDRGTKRKAYDDHVQVAFDPSELDRIHDQQQLNARFQDAKRAASASNNPYADVDQDAVAQVREELTKQRQQQAERKKQQQLGK